VNIPLAKLIVEINRPALPIMLLDHYDLQSTLAILAKLPNANIFIPNPDSRELKNSVLKNGISNNVHVFDGYALNMLKLVPVTSKFSCIYLDYTCTLPTLRKNGDLKHVFEKNLIVEDGFLILTLSYRFKKENGQKNMTTIINYVETLANSFRVQICRKEFIKKDCFHKMYILAWKIVTQKEKSLI